jgi:DNA polymerase-3 subunit epsilon
MRQIVVDTETTGLETAQGHRIIEIGCVELIDRKRTDNHFHHYICPERAIDAGAFDVHGISATFLADKPKFAEIANDFVNYVRDAEVIIHNAPFDVGFINHELTRLGKRWGRFEDYCSVLDSLALVREKHPGQRNSLDALCSRYSVDNSGRALHGALLDAEILSDVYLAITGGQTLLALDSVAVERRAREGRTRGQRGRLKVVRASAEELDAHHQRLDQMEEASGEQCLFRKLDA